MTIRLDATSSLSQRFADLEREVGVQPSEQHALIVAIAAVSRDDDRTVTNERQT